MAKILYVITEDWFFWTHRRALARACIAAGHEVVVACRVTAHRERLEGLGVRVIPIRMRRGSRNPISEVLRVAELARIYARERPDLVHHTSIKPVLYGSIAARLTGVPRVLNAIPGLGHVFVDRSMKGKAFRQAIVVAYRASLRLFAGRTRVVFENPQNAQTFLALGIVSNAEARVILGMGCDTTEFAPTAEPKGQDLIVMMAGRLLFAKGIVELVNAGRIARAAGVACRIVLVGAPDNETPGAVPEKLLTQWVNDDAAEWWGRTDNVAEALAKCNVLALPSTYGEGLPKVLMEAAAAGRCLIASDIPGCKEIVRHGWNGLLVQPGNTSEIAAAIQALASDAALRRQMGERGRALVEESFSDEVVNQQTLALYHELGIRHGDA